MTRYANGLAILSVVATLSTSATESFAAVPIEPMTVQMENLLNPLSNAEGWRGFMAQHSDCLGGVDRSSPAGVGVSDVTVNVDGKDYKVGVGCRSVFIAASPKTVVSIVNNARYFQALYGLDKPADTESAGNSPGASLETSFDAHIFKLVPGIETQDYTLHYDTHWSGDEWLVQTRLIKDDRHFALRATRQIVEPAGGGDAAIFREVGLFVPLRWWMNLVHGIVQSVTKRELAKLNWSVKCAAEKVQQGQTMTEEIARACQKEASNK
jgi:hypothetical protein